MNRKGKLLIIGGSKGIGLALATEAVKTYNDVIVMARSKTPELANLNVNFITQDFNEITLIKPTLEQWQPDTLVLCVAQGLYGDLECLPTEKITSCVHTTYVSTLFWIKEAINLLNTGSKIAWISSLTAKIPNKNWSFYASAKAGVEQFISCTREKANQKGINMTVCYPGCVATGFHEKAGTQIPPEAIAPSEIALELLEAIEEKVEIWAAKTDRKVIDNINQIMQTYQSNFKEYLK